jgi:hypothetical protein
MFLGHFAIAFAGKKRIKGFLLNQYFVGTMAGFIMARVIIDRHRGAPLSHLPDPVIPFCVHFYIPFRSLLTVICWGALFGSSIFLLTKTRRVHL